MPTYVQVFESPADYRADIDGLRGIAILAVVAFHAFPQQVRGGSVGVDVFFVISGYLISTHHSPQPRARIDSRSQASMRDVSAACFRR